MFRLPYLNEKSTDWIEYHRLPSPLSSYTGQQKMLCSSRLYFHSLAVVALVLLWGVGWRNGTVEALLVAVRSGQFKDGTQLKTDYTGVLAIDLPISLLVAFFFSGTNGQHPGYQHFLLDAYSTLQSAFVWLYVESARNQFKPASIKQYDLPVAHDYFILSSGR